MRLNSYKSVIIKFTKVKAHSGLKYNEMADQLAKSALQEMSEIIDFKQTDDKQIDEVDYSILKKCGSANESTTSVYFQIKGYRLSEKQLVKYVKEIWKKQGNKVKDLNLIDVSVDCERALIIWRTNDQVYEQIIKESIK